MFFDSDKLVTVYTTTTSNVAGANTVIYTVPAAKDFFLEYLDINENSAAAGHSPRHWEYLDTAGAGFALLHYLGMAFSAVGGGETTFPTGIYFNPFIKISAGQVIALTNDGTCANSVFGYIRGYLIDA